VCVCVIVGLVYILACPPVVFTPMIVVVTFARNKCFGLVAVEQKGLKAVQQETEWEGSSVIVSIFCDGVTCSVYWLIESVYIMVHSLCSGS
jgi:hypothetical protein